ncbi:hypothetical protein Pelo_9899 [Pelomyxa schiedti]|nr:hypothetical protein Pelo_9899 [Pelomyxa schiedti]
MATLFSSGAEERLRAANFVGKAAPPREMAAEAVAAAKHRTARDRLWTGCKETAAKRARLEGRCAATAATTTTATDIDGDAATTMGKQEEQEEKERTASAVVEGDYLLLVEKLGGSLCCDGVSFVTHGRDSTPEGRLANSRLLEGQRVGRLIRLQQLRFRQQARAARHKGRKKKQLQRYDGINGNNDVRRTTGRLAPSAPPTQKNP